MARPKTSFVLVLALFCVSGFAGLLYEVAWTRELRLVFGTAELAVATVLAAYLAGLGLGAAVAGPRVSRIRRPLLAYGLLSWVSPAPRCSSRSGCGPPARCSSWLSAPDRSCRTRAGSASRSSSSPPPSRS